MRSSTARPAELRPETLRRLAHRPADDAGHSAPIKATAAATRSARADQLGDDSDRMETTAHSDSTGNPEKRTLLSVNGKLTSQNDDAQQRVYIAVSNLYTKTAHRLEQSEAVFFATFSQFCHNNSRKLRFLRFELHQMFVWRNSGTQN